MRYFSIDPGPEESAFMVYRADIPTAPIGDFAILDNEPILGKIRDLKDYFDILVIEMVASYGMPVGKKIFRTVLWIGRFIQQAVVLEKEYQLIERLKVRLHVCHDSRAGNANIRQALIDRFGPPGLKKEPGITYGIHKHIWSALALAVTAAET